MKCTYHVSELSKNVYTKLNLEFFIIVTIVDVVVKTILLLTSAFPTLGLDWRRRILLHYTTTSMTLILVALNRLKTEQVDYLSQLDPYCGLFASLVLTIIVVPTSKERKLKIYTITTFSM